MSGVVYVYNPFYNIFDITSIKEHRSIIVTLSLVI